MFLLKEYEVSQFSEISGILEACMITVFWGLYQYKDAIFIGIPRVEKMVFRSHLHNESPYSGKTTSLY